MRRCIRCLGSPSSVTPPLRHADTSMGYRTAVGEGQWKALRYGGVEACLRLGRWRCRLDARRWEGRTRHLRPTRTVKENSEVCRPPPMMTRHQSRHRCRSRSRSRHRRPLDSRRPCHRILKCVALTAVNDGTTGVAKSKKENALTTATGDFDEVPPL